VMRRPHVTEGVLPPSGPARARSIALLAAATVLLARAALVTVYGSSLPFWDQWGAEGTDLYAPLLERRYDWHLLWSSHNEHRIALTRLFSVGVLVLNDLQWDARVQCLANSLVVAASVALFALYLQRCTTRSVSTWLCAYLVLAASLPFGWENTIAGFQNGFYFLALLAVLLLHVSAHLDPSPAAFVLVALLSALSVLSMAPGVVAVVTAIGVLALRVLCGRRSLGGMLWLALPLVLVAAATLLTQPRLPYHDVYRAQGLAEYLKAATIATSWPLPPPGVLLLLAPLVFFLRRSLERRSLEPVDAVFAGLGVWSVLVGLAIAYSRGHGMGPVSSRYTDLLALGGMGPVYFALRLRDRGWAHGGGAAKAVSVGLPVLVVLGLVYQSALGLPSLRERRFLTSIEATNVRAFLEGNPKALEGKPLFYIPSSRAAALASALADPTLQSILPLSVHPKGVPGPRATACRWLPQETRSGSSAEGVITCRPFYAPIGPADQGAIGVGKLSVVAHGLWQLLAVDVFPRFGRLPAISAGGRGIRCGFDGVNGEKPQAGNIFTAYYPSVIRFSGWAGTLHARSEGRPLRVSLVALEGGAHFGAWTSERAARPDAVAALGDAGLTWSGFDFVASGAGLPRGLYRIQLAEPGSASCDTGHFLNVEKEYDARLTY
jgi:hypothetical protein